MSADERSGVLGQALIDTWRKGSKGTYRAIGWHAQISQLTAVKAGARAVAAAGLVVKKRETLIAWLSETREPSAANKKLINRAYEILAGRAWDPSFQTRTYAIYGYIDAGDDRGADSVRTLNIGIGDYEDAKWDRIKQEYEKRNPDPKEIEDFFIEDVIEEDIGDASASGGWSFPGSSYTIT